jgi:hypothetical protein
MKLLAEFKVLSKSGLGFRIGKSCVEISLLSHRKTSEFATSRKIENNIFLYFLFFSLKLHFWSFLIKIIKINKIQSKYENMKINFFSIFSRSGDFASFALRKLRYLEAGFTGVYQFWRE